MKSLWWNQVTNAVKFVADIKQSLLEEKSILLKYSEAMPWREQFDETVREYVKLQNSEKKFEDVPVVKEPGEYLLNEFCKKEKRAEYRPSKGYAKFFAESDDIVLHDRYFWVQADNTEYLEKWLTFVSEYLKERGKNDRIAVFIIEWSGKSQPPIKKGIKLYSFDDYINEYDRIVFSVLASSEVKGHLLIKNYITELVSNVVGNDIELCAECIKGYKSFLKDPVEYLSKVTRENVRSDGSAFSYNKDLEEINHLIWLAQIKTVYPHLEEYREEFVQKHSSDIAKQLPIQASYGEIYSDPKDVELGTLMYMAGNKHLSLSPAEYEKLKRYKDARNKLSHLTALSISEIEELI